MTTLVAMNTMDALVMGCDSLGTVTKRLVDPFDLFEFFDGDDKFKIRRGDDGQPILRELLQIYKKAQDVPYNSMTFVDKLFSLSPLCMGVMFAGLTAIGNRTISSFIGEFRSTTGVKELSRSSYTVKGVATTLNKYLWSHYEKEYPDEHIRPELELLIGGYNRRKPTPGVSRVYVHKNEVEDTDYDFGLYFGAQTAEIQRLIFGTDLENRIKLIERTGVLLEKYRELLAKHLEKEDKPIDLPNPGTFGRELRLFDNWRLSGMRANWGAFSVQNAIDCVDFLVNIMVNSQRFNERMPMVGGPVQVAVIQKDSGFRYISPREWRHGENTARQEEKDGKGTLIPHGGGEGEVGAARKKVRRSPSRS